MPSKKAILGWVLVSYFLIAGGVALAAVSVAFFAVASRATSDAIFFLGALVGGLVAGRASRHKAVAEPAVAALLVVGTMMAIFSLGLGRSFPWDAGDGILPLPVQLGLVAGLGGLVGGLIGRRSRARGPEESAWRWWGVAMLINLGATFMLVSLSMVWLGGRGEDADLGAVFLGLALAWLLGGFCAQAIMPRRMIWVSGAGSFGIVLLGAAFSVTHGDLNGSTIIGAGFLWGIGTLIGAFGAVIGWKLVASRVAAAPSVELPEVRLRS